MMSEGEALDIATRIGIQAKFEYLTKTQIENLLSSLDFARDPKASLLVSAAFAYRQAARLRKGKRTAALVAEALKQVYEKGEKEDARKILRLAKWIFEIVENIRLNISPSDIPHMNFMKLMEQLNESVENEL
ncbi:MAG: hypothetical protein QXU11_11810 [Thermoproteota archaeon]